VGRYICIWELSW